MDIANMDFDQRQSRKQNIADKTFNGLFKIMHYKPNLKLVRSCEAK